MKSHLWIRLLVLGGLVLFVFPGLPHASAAEPARRWLAEPTLLTDGTKAAQVDLAVVDDRHVWAIADQLLLFWNGSTWTAQHHAPEPFVDIEMLNPTTGWAVTLNATYAFDGSAWTVVDNFQRDIRNLFLSADGTLFAQVWNGFSGGNSTTSVAVFRDTYWYTLISSTAYGPGFVGPYVHLGADGSAWIWGQPYSSDPIAPATPLLFHYDQNNLTQIELPVSAEYLQGVYMHSSTQGVILLRDTAGAVLSYQYNDGTWQPIEFPVPENMAFLSSYAMDVVAYNQQELITTLSLVGDSACERTLVYRYINNTWTIIDDNRAPLFGSLSPDGSQGWFSQRVCLPAGNFVFQRYRYADGTFSRDESGSSLGIQHYILHSDNAQWGVGAGTIFRYAQSTVPTEHVEPLESARYFPETGHNVVGAFWDYYRSHGLDFGEPAISMAESLALFGLPLTEQFYELNPDLGEMVLVQYFERARMEYHPANAPEYRVLLGRMGAVRYIQNHTFISNGPPNQPVGSGCERIEQTNYDLCPPFRDYWQSVGSPQIFGWPIAAMQQEQSITDGNTYLTLWTERQRLEHHPEFASTRYEILLGLLGKEDLQVRGFLQ